MIWIYQTENEEQMTKQKPENKYEQSSPEALHKMTFTRDTLHQIHVIPQHPDTSISICQSLGTQHILHIIYICAQEPS